MQFIIILGLLLAVTAWLVRTYHRLEQLRILANSNWQLVLASLHRRNAVLKDFIYLLSSQDENDMLLRQLRHAQSDLELCISTHKPQTQSNKQLLNIQTGETKLQHALNALLPAIIHNRNHQFIEIVDQVKQQDHLRMLNIRQYNAAVFAYMNSLSHVPNHYIASLFHLPRLHTIEATELLK